MGTPRLSLALPLLILIYHDFTTAAVVEKPEDHMSMSGWHAALINNSHTDLSNRGLDRTGTEFILVSSGANCEASGYQTVTSEAECHAGVPTIQALGLLVEAKGTVEGNFGPSGCYLRHDGPLWYNTMVQSPAHCSGASKCVCVTTPTSSGDCPKGYTLKPGDVPGWGSVSNNPKSSTSTVSDCSALCDLDASCFSFEYSVTTRICNLNKEKEPTSGRFEDYSFCSKDKREIYETREGENSKIECAWPAVIKIKKASYGDGTRSDCSKDATDKVKEKCHGHSCSFKVDNGLVGDPCPNHAKKLSITYVCQVLPIVYGIQTYTNNNDGTKNDISVSIFCGGERICRKKLMSENFKFDAGVVTAFKKGEIGECAEKRCDKTVEVEIEHHKKKSTIGSINYDSWRCDHVKIKFTSGDTCRSDFSGATGKPGPTETWKKKAVCNPEDSTTSLFNGQTMFDNEELTSPSGIFHLKIEKNGNLVFYKETRTLWESNSRGYGPFRLDMQIDNNLVLYDCRGKTYADCGHSNPIWAPKDWTEDRGRQKGKAYLDVKDEGKFVIADDYGTLWENHNPIYITHDAPACSHFDKVFRKDSKDNNDVSEHHCPGPRESGPRRDKDNKIVCFTKSARQCQRMCQNVNREVGICTHFSYDIEHEHCRLYDGPMNMDEAAVDLKTIIGPVYCYDDRLKIVRNATAAWVRVAVCTNTANISLKCEYQKMVGVARANGNSRSQSTESSQEHSKESGKEHGWESSRESGRESAREFSTTFGLSYTGGTSGYGLTAEMTSSLEISQSTSESVYESNSESTSGSTSSSISNSRSNTWSQEASTTFEKSVTEETTYTASFPVGMDQTISMCQPQGWVGDFKVYSSFFKAVEGESCTKTLSGGECFQNHDCDGKLVCDGKSNKCRTPSTDLKKPDEEFCSGGNSRLCQEGEGHCKGHDECEGSLECGFHNCGYKGKYAYWNCCRKPADKASFMKSSFISGVIGCYQLPNPTNDWSYVEITWNENAGSFTWENRAKKKWSLTLIPIGTDWDTTNLAVGSENPNFNEGYKFAGLEWKGVPGKSELSAIKGPWNVAYLRKTCQGIKHEL